MIYNGYIEGFSNGVYLREHFQRGFKTLAGLKRSIDKWLEENKVVKLGYVLYTFSGDQARKYQRSEYKIIDQYNAKTFFEYWNQ